MEKATQNSLFQGYPIFGSIAQFHQSNSDYILHLDSDMIFYQVADFSWIQEGVKIMKKMKTYFVFYQEVVLNPINLQSHRVILIIKLIIQEVCFLKKLYKQTLSHKSPKVPKFITNGNPLVIMARTYKK